MCQSAMEFVETICVEKGCAANLSYHNARMNRTRRDFYGDSVLKLKLEDWVCAEGYEACTRCRVVYGRDIIKVEYFPYLMRNVNSLRLVTCDDADYAYKYADRSLLNRLFEQRGDADDVLVVREGLLTDTSIANIALYDGEQWYTPAVPLLKGTRRQSLLDEGTLTERVIRAEDVHQYQRIRLFNAMIPFGKIELSTQCISAI